MPGGRQPEDFGGSAPPKLGFLQRLLLVLPHFTRDSDKAPLGDRLRNAVLKPVEPGTGSETGAKSKAKNDALSVEELEAANRAADDKERLVGLLGAPFAAGIGIIVIATLITNDPPAFLKNGQVNKLHVSVGTYHTLELVLLALAFAMLATAWFRKRLLLGIVMALYGLAVFNLHYWGFGIPFILAAAWLLVRSYRLQRELREANGDVATGPGSRRSGRRASATAPRPNKRYTPPAPSPKRSSPPKPHNEKNEKKAG
jgi:hypothetical protein